MQFGPKMSCEDPDQAQPKKSYQLASNIQRSEQSELIDEKIVKPLDSSPLTIIARSFIRKLKDAIFIKPLPKNSSTLFKYMTDASYILKEEDKEIFKKIMISMNKFLKRLIISPDNHFRMAWNIVSLVFMSFCFFCIPFEISFDITNHTDKIYSIFAFFIFLFDILLNFITGDFIKGFLVMRPKAICKNYIKGLFLFDILAFIYSVVDLVNHGNQNFDGISYRFLILAKIPTFLYYIKLVLNYLKLEYKYQNFIDILKLLGYSLFLAHLLACFWHLCAELNSQKNWLIFYKIQDETPEIKYIYSLYWVIVTIMTVGYGDITPQNPYEAIFAMITIIFGCGLYAFNLNSIGIILQNSQKKEHKFRDELRIINRFMDRKNIDVKLQRKVQEYLNFLWIEQNLSNNEEESVIINRLNETLREELLLESYGGIFLNSPFFLQNFNEKSLRKLVKIIKEVKFIPGDEIFEVFFKEIYCK